MKSLIRPLLRERRRLRAVAERRGHFLRRRDCPPRLLTTLEAVVRCMPTSLAMAVIDLVGSLRMRRRTAATARGVHFKGLRGFFGLGCGPLPLSRRFRTRKMVLRVVPRLAMMSLGTAPTRMSTAMSSRFFSAIAINRYNEILCYCFESGNSYATFDIINTQPLTL